MQQKKPRKYRRIEVWTGLFLILVAFSYVASLLLDFKFVSPDGTVQEDLSYLSEHVQNQLISSIAWGVTALMTLLAIPFYLAVFRKVFRILTYLNILFLLGAAAGFFLMAMAGYDLHNGMVRLMGEGFDLNDEQVTLTLLDLFRHEQLVRLLGSSCVGLFTMGLGVTRFRVRSFPVTSSILMMVSGPAMIFFNWYDPDHLARTGAMTGIIVGIVVLSVRLINKGLNINSLTRKADQ